MEIIIKARPEEIAALVVALQERQGEGTLEFAMRSIQEGLKAGFPGQEVQL